MRTNFIPAFALSITASVFAGCYGDEEAHAGEPCCAEDAPAAISTEELPETSVFLLDSDWTDQLGAPRKLDDFRGKLTVTAMIFTNCDYACPRILVDLRTIESAIPIEQRDDVQFLLVSMDTKRDTPDVLAAYAQSKGLDPNHWTLLHGEEFAVRGIGAALGVRYKRDVKGDYSHSNLITVLDEEGRILHQLEGLNADTKQTVEAIQKELL